MDPRGARREELRGADELAAAKTECTPVPLVPPGDLNPNKTDTLTTSSFPLPPPLWHEPSAPPSTASQSTTIPNEQCPAAEMLKLDTSIPPVK